jgi:hypothetical protein
VRDHEPIEIAIPGARRVVGAAVFLLAILVFTGWVPFASGTLAVALLLCAAGLLI